MTFVKGLNRAETPEETLERLTMPVPPSECWMWLGHHNHGYAIIMHRRGKRRIMDRVTRFLMNAPKGMEVDHLCHQPWCVNPYHLEVVTHLENIRRHFAWKVANRPNCEKHDEPLRYYGRLRICRTCLNEYQNQRRAHKYPHKGQRKFKCDKCGASYEILARPPNRGPRYGCHACLKEYKRRLYARMQSKKIPQSNLLKSGGNFGPKSQLRSTPYGAARNSSKEYTSG